MGNIRRHIRLVEALSEWRGLWVHYTDHPMLTMNPKPGHNDPVGIYFFPASFAPNSFWKSKPYRFEAKLRPEARVLDVSQITQEQLDHLIDTTGVRAAYDEYHGQYPKESVIKRFDMAWEMMQRGRFESGLTSAKWNKALRATGWDAIFDDTASIHSSEVQLLVLDPRVIEVTGMVRQKTDAYDAMNKVINDLVEVCEPFGEVTVERPKRERQWGRTTNTIVGGVEVRRGEDNYAEFRISHDLGTTRPIVNVNMRWSRPSLGYGSGATYEIAVGKYQFDGLKSVERDLAKVFAEAVE